MKSYLQFRIVHLLLLMLVISFLLWLPTQMATERVILRIDNVEELEFYWPDGDRENFGNEYGVLKFRFVEPAERANERIIVFLKNTESLKATRDWDRPFSFRYRTRDIYWLKKEDRLQRALQKFAIPEDHIEQIIEEVVH